MKRVIFSTLCCVSLTASAAMAYDPVGDRAAKILANYNQTGEFVRCVSYRNLKGIKILDDDKILFATKDNKRLLNTMSTSCNRLGVDRQLSFQNGISKICARDVVNTARGGCNLGKFEKLEEISFEKILNN